MNLPCTFDVPAEAIALIADDGARVPLSGPDPDGYQTPEWGGFTAVGVVVRVEGGLLTLDMPQFQPVPANARFQRLTPLRATTY